MSNVYCVVCGGELHPDRPGVVLATGEAFHHDCAGSSDQTELSEWVDYEK